MRDFIVYIAGPYRAPTEHGVQQNIDRARAAAIEIAEMGLGFFCPHLNSAHMGGVIPDDDWIEMDLVFLRDCCKAILMLDGWDKSEGSLEEYARARSLGLLVFHGINALKNNLDLVKGPSNA